MELIDKQDAIPIEWIKEWIEEHHEYASRVTITWFLECKPCSISICANGRSRMSNGFQWRFFSAESFSEKIPSIKDKSGNTVVYNKRSYSHHVRKISQYSKSGQLINVWDNYKQLEKEGFSNGNIYKCLNGKYKSAYGYIWKYSD